MAKKDEELSEQAASGTTKCQLNSKGLFGVIVWTKKPTKFLKDFCPLKRVQIKELVDNSLSITFSI